VWSIRLSTATGLHSNSLGRHTGRDGCDLALSPRMPLNGVGVLSVLAFLVAVILVASRRMGFGDVLHTHTHRCPELVARQCIRRAPSLLSSGGGEQAEVPQDLPWSRGEGDGAERGEEGGGGGGGARRRGIQRVILYLDKICNYT
jgi:hypothetical protein